MFDIIDCIELQGESRSKQDEQRRILDEVLSRETLTSLVELLVTK